MIKGCLYDRHLTHSQMKYTRRLFVRSGILFLSLWREYSIDIQAERDSWNLPADDLLPVLPHELVRLCPGEFGVCLIAEHLRQLQLTWTDEDIEWIEHDYRELWIAYKVDSSFKSIIDQCDGNMSFRCDWELMKGQYASLWDFCEGIATVLANTATVESDFSILG